jgi:hypothetical protein
MWLINVHTLQLSAFFEPCPQYIILSHRWGNEEVTFQDFQQGTNKHKFGYDKILRFCDLIKAQWPSIHHAWVDTCCIDKASNAELSEAINSMYRWYKQAHVCVAYLQDTSTAAKVSKSEWFQRGWTLQELLAPSCVLFYNEDWHILGAKHDPRLLNEISAVTRIDADALLGPFDPSQHVVAAKFSWMASRKTTRVEDLAYCLFGLCGVNLPLIYGEGDRAFLRLQEEILKQYDDSSLFCWTSGPPMCKFSLLAPSPSCFLWPTRSFREPKAVFKLGRYVGTERRGVEISNQGISLELDLQPYCFNTWLVPLTTTPMFERSGCLSMAIRRDQQGYFQRIGFKGQWTFRSLYSNQEYWDENHHRITFMQQAQPEDSVHTMPGDYGFEIWSISKALSRVTNLITLFECPQDQNLLPLLSGYSGIAGLVHMDTSASDEGKHRVLAFGFDGLFNVVCLALQLEPITETESGSDHRDLIFRNPLQPEKPIYVLSRRCLNSLTYHLQAVRLVGRRITLQEHGIELQVVSWEDFRSHVLRLSKLTIGDMSLCLELLEDFVRVSIDLQESAVIDTRNTASPHMDLKHVKQWKPPTPAGEG